VLFVTLSLVSLLVQCVKFKLNDALLAHRLMIECGVLHGDLSPNNFIIHEGIGYFIDFDHAGFIEEGKACTVSFGTVS
jgi:serine/threonine-protein kinase RIO1